jgi:class 3 adenylate cyclase
MNDPRFAMHAATLSFADPIVEADFWRGFAVDLRRYFQLGSVLLPALFAAFGLVDPVVAGDRVGLLWAVRFGFAVPALVALALVFNLERFRPLVERRVQELLLLEAIVALGSLLAIGAVQHSLVDASMLEISAMGLILSMGALYGMSRLRFLYAAPTGALGALVPLVMLAFHPARTAEFAGVSVFYAVVITSLGVWISRTLELIARREFVREEELRRARARSDALLRNALPEGIAERLRASADRPSFAERHEEVTVVQADLVGFTPLTRSLPLAELAPLLDELFASFDTLCERHRVEKIKTLGDGWIACAGAPVARPDHAEAACALALDMLAVVGDLRARVGQPLAMRIGVCTGPVSAGVIGKTRFAYDLWGEAVAGAAGLEASGQPGRVRISEVTAARLGPSFAVIREPDARGIQGLWLQPPLPVEAGFQPAAS